MGEGEKKPYRAPHLRVLAKPQLGCATWSDEENAAFRRRFSPLGDTPEKRIAKAAERIQATLDQLPPEERDEAIYSVIGASKRWVKLSDWSP